MLWKRTRQFRKNRCAIFCIILCAISLILLLSVSGCGKIYPEGTRAEEVEREIPTVEDSGEEDTKIADICQELYKKAAEENKTEDLEMIRSIVNCLGENGYPAVDSRNQIDMANARLAVQFCEKAEAEEKAEITILVAGYSCDLIKYDLRAEDGNIDVARSYFKYENEKLQKEATESYRQITGIIPRRVISYFQVPGFQRNSMC